MAITDNYQELTNPHMITVFENLFALKQQKKLIDNQIKALEAEYKPSIESANRDELFYVLPSTGQKFNIKKSTRKGGWKTKKVEEFIETHGYDEDEFRNKPSTIFTLRIEETE